MCTTELSQEGDQDYVNAKLLLEDIASYRDQGARVRSRVQENEYAEKRNKFFYKKERVSYEKKTIDKLVVNEKEITKPNDILNELMIFYKALYASSSPNNNSEQFKAMLQEPGLPKLSQEDQHKCEGLVTYEE